MADIKDFAKSHPGLKIWTIGKETTFTLRPTPRGVAIERSGAKKPQYVTESEEFFERFNTHHWFVTTRYQDVTFCASYLLATIREILAERETLPPAAELPVEELEILAAPATEREALRKSRIGHGKYRNDLIDLRRRCYVTGLADTRFLRASHILPWKDSDNRQRLDPHNGLLLAPHYDALFNDGFISFADDGQLLVSRHLPDVTIAAFGLNPDFVGMNLGARTQEYLAMHRKRVFQHPAR